jgi:hypothetical protein
MYTFYYENRFLVSFQDVEKTNILLKKAGIADKLDEMTKDEVAKALGVGISGTFESEQSKSEGAAVLQLFY